jgi:chromosome segregation ATPase
LNLPSLSQIPLKRYSQDSSNEKEYQEIQKKYITAQEEINELRKEVGRLKDAHQSEKIKLDSLRQSIFKLLKFFDLSDRFIIHAPSDVENALSMICKELDK